MKNAILPEHPVALENKCYSAIGAERGNCHIGRMDGRKDMLTYKPVEVNSRLKSKAQLWLLFSKKLDRVRVLMNI